MVADNLPSRLGTPVTVDLCLRCQVIWFDAHESLQLSPAAVLQLFRMIGEHAVAAPAAGAVAPVCPRCGLHLILTTDQQRNTRFHYLRCARGDGRLITFVDFLREKDFIRPLTPQQIEELRRNVQVINCSNCGAPIDLTTSSACAHCGSPISMLDMNQAGAMVSALHEAEQPHPIDPALPLRLVQARREVETVFASFDREPGWYDDAARRGLVAAGLSSFARWLKDRM
ncbi:MAG TPA: zinc ribbon domain-containing protein [Vicinamibacterales bacterium]|jgi:hypothetical protein